MQQDELIIIIICIGVIVLTVACAIVWRCYRTKRTEQPSYEIADNYSNVGSEFIFDQTKNSKIWLGQSGINKMEHDQREAKLQKKYDQYATAMKIATNYCRDPSLREGQRKIRDDLPCIGYRNDVKFFYPISDPKLEQEIVGNAVLLLHIDVSKCPANAPNILDKSSNDDMNQGLGDFCCIDFNDDQQFRAFRLTMESFDHEYLALTYEVGLSRDKNHIFMFRDFFKNGSLRDHIYNADLSQPYSEKYNRPGKGLTVPQIRKYGRQILEAMNYLSQCGIVNYHLHSGNIMIHYFSDLDGSGKNGNNTLNASNRASQGGHSLSLSLRNRSSNANKKNLNSNIKLTGIENNFLGLLPKHPYYKHVCALKKLYPDLNVELMLFGYILFEMICGIESPMPSPLDCMHEIEQSTNKVIPREIKDILGRIFGDKSFGQTYTIDDIIALPFFNAKNAPPIKTDGYTSLRDENEIVNKIRNVSVMQCYYTFSKQALIGDTVSKSLKGGDSPNKRRKKRKKKKKRNSRASSTAGSAGQNRSLLVDASLLDDEDDDDDDDDFNGFG